MNGLRILRTRYLSSRNCGEANLSGPGHGIEWEGQSHSKRTKAHRLIDADQLLNYVHNGGRLLDAPQ